MTDQPTPTPTPTPRTDAVAHAGHNESVYIARMTYLARELERELAACVPGMELIARMLSDERALADRLAAALDTLLAGYDDAKEIACFTVAEEHTASRAIEAWKEARRE